MSRHKHKSRDMNNFRNSPFNNCVNNNPFGISPQQLLGLLGSNIDMSGINNILSSMGQEGFNINAVNGQMNDYNAMNNNMNNQKSYEDMNMQQEVDIKVDNSKMPNVEVEDDNIKFLQNIRSIVSGERAEFIDKVIEVYSSGGFKDFKK